MKLTQALINQAMQAFNAGQYEITISTLAAVYQQHPMAEMLYATALGKTERFPESFDIFRRLQKQYPQNADVSYNYALLLKESGNLDNAEKQLSLAIKYNPQYHVAHHALGNVLLEQSRVEDAQSAFENALRCNPQSGQYAQSLSKSLYLQGKWQELITFLTRDNLLYLDVMLAELYVEACYRVHARNTLYQQKTKLSQTFLSSYSIHYFLALSELESKRYGSAKALTNTALSLASEEEQKEEMSTYAAYIDWLVLPSDSHFAALETKLAKTNNTQLLELAFNLYENRRDTKQAQQFLDKLTQQCSQSTSPNSLAQLSLKEAQIHFANDDIDRGIKALDVSLEASPFSLPHLYQKIRLLDKQQRFEEAEDIILSVANATSQYRTDKFSDLNGGIELGSFGIAPVQADITSTNDTEMLFIVGFPRSGTTLIENMLLKQGNVTLLEETDSAATFCQQLQEGGMIEALTGSLKVSVDEEDESTAIAKLNSLADDYLNHLKAYAPTISSGTLIVDKMPLNFPYLPAMLTLFPKAKVLCCVRHPKAVALSCLQFEEINLYSVDTFAEAYDKVFSCWKKLQPVLGTRAMTMKYETLVSEPESTLEALLQYVGLSKMEGGVERSENASLIQTPSYFQVNQPIYTSSVQKFEKYPRLFEHSSELLSHWQQYWGYA